MFLDNIKESVVSHLYGEKEPYSFERLQQILASLREIKLLRTALALDISGSSKRIKNPSIEDVLCYFGKLPCTIYYATGIKQEFTPPHTMRVKHVGNNITVRFYADNDRRAYLKGRRGGSAPDDISAVTHPSVL